MRNVESEEQLNSNVIRNPSVIGCVQVSGTDAEGVAGQSRMAILLRFKSIK